MGSDGLSCVPMRSFALWTLALMFVGCGSSTPAPKSAAPADDPPAVKSKSTEREKPATKDDADSSEDDAPIPTKCAKSDPCVPSPAYVKKLCAKSYPSVALNFFRGGTPWARGYLKQRTEAINASGGVSGEGYLEFDEEVIILQKRKSDYGGMQVSGAMGGYYVLRWDGTCNDIAGEELTMSKPPQPKSSKDRMAIFGRGHARGIAQRQSAQRHDQCPPQRMQRRRLRNG